MQSLDYFGGVLAVVDAIAEQPKPDSQMGDLGHGLGLLKRRFINALS